jgi:hypothetical protein
MRSAAPWYVWCAVAATTSSMIGIEWDISWHRTIGRDSFLTPAHLAIYLCGVLAGISCGYLILTTTFSQSAAALRDASVKIWGFRGPLGAFVAAWGGIAMLTSAPFDNWWHNAYGLDVKIISPPHMVLAVGMFSVQLGALLLVLSYKNNTGRDERGTLDWLYLFTSGLVIANMATLILEYTFRGAMHSGSYYIAIALALPVFLVALAEAAQVSWAATKISLFYVLFWNGMNWILPLFPGEPKLGPVLNPVTHFVPSFFSILLVFPALAVDWILDRFRDRAHFFRAATAASAFTAILVAVQWHFGTFLLSPYGRNWFFYAHMFDYRAGERSFQRRFLFLPWQGAVEFSAQIAIAAIITIVTMWLGLRWADWLRKVRR